MCTGDVRRCPLPENHGARLDLSTRNSFCSCAPTAYFEIGAVQWMGLPLVTVLLQSAVASGLAVGRRVCECGFHVLFTSGHCSKTVPQRAVATMENRCWPDEAEYLRCKKLLFAFPEALRTLVLDSIVWGSQCASITASQ